MGDCLFYIKKPKTILHDTVIPCLGEPVPIPIEILTFTLGLLDFDKFSYLEIERVSFGSSCNPKHAAFNVIEVPEMNE